MYNGAPEESRQKLRHNDQETHLSSCGDYPIIHSCGDSAASQGKSFAVTKSGVGHDPPQAALIAMDAQLKHARRHDCSNDVISHKRRRVVNCSEGSIPPQSALDALSHQFGAAFQDNATPDHSTCGATSHFTQHGQSFLSATSNSSALHGDGTVFQVPNLLLGSQQPHSWGERPTGHNFVSHSLGEGPTRHVFSSVRSSFVGADVGPATSANLDSISRTALSNVNFPRTELFNSNTDSQSMRGTVENGDRSLLPSHFYVGRTDSVSDKRVNCRTTEESGASA